MTVFIATTRITVILIVAVIMMMTVQSSDTDGHDRNTGSKNNKSRQNSDGLCFGVPHRSASRGLAFLHQDLCNRLRTVL